MYTYIVKVLLSCGTTAWHDEYTIQNVTNLIVSEKGYYYLETEDGSEYRFPIKRTILKKIKL